MFLTSFVPIFYPFDYNLFTFHQPVETFPSIGGRLSTGWWKAVRWLVEHEKVVIKGGIDYEKEGKFI